MPWVRVESLTHLAAVWAGALALAVLLGWRAQAVGREDAALRAAVERILPGRAYLYDADDGPPSAEALALHRIERRGVRLHRERLALAAGFVALAGVAAAAGCRRVYAVP